MPEPPLIYRYVLIHQKQRLRLPDGFEWCGPWRVLRTNSTDAQGWRYANRAHCFDSHHSGRAHPILSDRARRRRWVRPMRRAAGAEGGDGVRQLRSVLLQGDAGEMQLDGGPVMLGGGERKHEALLLLLGEEGMAGAELLPAPPEGGGAVEDGGGEGEGEDLDLWALGRAFGQQAMKQAREEFSFKGFGLTFTKSLVRKDFGVGTCSYECNSPPPSPSSTPTFPQTSIRPSAPSPT